MLKTYCRVSNGSNSKRVLNNRISHFGQWSLHYISLTCVNMDYELLHNEYDGHMITILIGLETSNLSWKININYHIYPNMTCFIADDNDAFGTYSLTEYNRTLFIVIQHWFWLLLGHNSGELWEVLESKLPPFGHPQSGIIRWWEPQLHFHPPTLSLYKAGDKTWWGS